MTEVQVLGSNYISDSSDIHKYSGLPVLHYDLVAELLISAYRHIGKNCFTDIANRAIHRHICTAYQSIVPEFTISASGIVTATILPINP